MAKIVVYPTKATSLNITHPVDGEVTMDGSQWEQDGFTARMLTDGLLTVDKARGYRGPVLGSSPRKTTSSQGIAGARGQALGKSQ